MGHLQKAADAAFAFHHFNPEDETGLSNERYYKGLEEVDSQAAIVGNPLPHVNPARSAFLAYSAEKFEEAVGLFEETVKAYQHAMERCFADCEHSESIPIPHTGHFMYDLALAYRNLLRCQLKCPRRLERVGSITVDDLWPEIYGFLQYSYYKGWQ